MDIIRLDAVPTRQIAQITAGRNFAGDEFKELAIGLPYVIEKILLQMGSESKTYHVMISDLDYGYEVDLLSGTSSTTVQAVMTDPVILTGREFIKITTSGATSAMSAILTCREWSK